MNDTIYEFEVAFAFSVVKLVKVPAESEEAAKKGLIEKTEAIINNKEIKPEDCPRPIKTVLTVAVRDTGGYRSPANLFTQNINKQLLQAKKNV